MATESFDSVFRLTKESAERLLEKMDKMPVRKTPEEIEALKERMRENDLACKEMLECWEQKGIRRVK